MAPRKTILLSIVACGLTMTSCINRTIYHEYHDVDLWNWKEEDTVIFELPKIVRSGTIEASLGVRSTNSFNYQTLKMLGILECDGVELQEDTIKICIYNDKGINNGEGFPYVTTIDTIPSFTVDSGMNYRYKIIQVMEVKKLKGIANIGLELSIKE